MRRRGYIQRVTIGIGRRDITRADGGAGARLAQDDYRTRPFAAYLLRQRPRHAVGRATGRIRDHQADDARGITGRLRQRRPRRQQRQSPRPRRYAVCAFACLLLPYAAPIIPQRQPAAFVLSIESIRCAARRCVKRTHTTCVNDSRAGQRCGGMGGIDDCHTRSQDQVLGVPAGRLQLSRRRLAASGGLCRLRHPGETLGRISRRPSSARRWTCCSSPTPSGCPAPIVST